MFILSIDTLIDRETIDIIRDRGFSRIPIYYGEHRTFIIGVLIVKSLLGVDISKPKTIRELS